MKILLLTTLVAFAAADVSHLTSNNGYQYNSPSFSTLQTSYGAPGASVVGNGGSSFASYSSGSSGQQHLSLPSSSGSTFQFNGGYSSNPSSISGATVQTFENGGFSTPKPLSAADLSSLQVSSSPSHVDYSNIQVSTPSSVGSNPAVNFVQYQQPSSSYQFLSKFSQPTISTVGLSGTQYGSDATLNSGFGQASFSNFGSQYASKTSGGSINEAFGVATDAAQGNLEPEVSKHLYFFAAPEEELEAEAKVNLPAVPPKKTYKIIFIKAPTYRNQAAITVPAVPQNEEKTLVYVLVKKPEANANVRFQQAAAAKPSKPEVFFIKYKTQKEAEEAVAEIQSKHGATGQVIANLPAGQSINQFQIPESAVSSSSDSVDFGSFGQNIVSSTQSPISYVSSTPSSVGFEGVSYGSSTPSSVGFDAGSFGSSTPSSVGFDAGSYGSSTPSSVGFDGVSYVSSTPSSVGSEGVSYVSSTPSSVGFQSYVSSAAPQFSSDSFSGFGNAISSGQNTISADSGFQSVGQQSGGYQVFGYNGGSSTPSSSTFQVNYGSHSSLGAGSSSVDSASENESSQASENVESHSGFETYGPPKQ